MEVHRLLSDALLGREARNSSSSSSSSSRADELATEIVALLLDDVCGGEMNQLFRDRVRCFVFGLGKNDELRSRLVGGEVRVEEFVAMTAEEMLDPETRRKRSEKREAVTRARLQHVKSATTDLYRCEKCGGRSVHVEPRMFPELTALFSCVLCGHRWR